MLDAADPKDIDVHTLNKLLDVAKRQVFIGKNAVFMGSLLCQVPVIWSHRLRTAAASPTTIYWNPTWFLKLPEKTRGTILLHELWHIALLHHARAEGKASKTWNKAADIVINNGLEADGHSFQGTRPWKYRPFDGLDVETVYERLMENHIDASDLEDAGSWGEEMIEDEALDPHGDNSAPVWDDEEGDMIPDVSQEEIDRQVRIVSQAKTQAEILGGGFGDGGLAGQVERVLRQFLEPKVAWEGVLQEFCSDRMPANEPNYKRPNRRFPDEFMPSKGDDDRLAHLAFINDASGSVSDSMMVRLNSEVKYVKEHHNPEKLSLLMFDTIIQSETVFLEDDHFDAVTVKGRGGTDLRCVYEWLKKNKPIGAVILSDLECPPMEEFHDCPILWICINNPHATVKSGKIIHIRE